MGLRTLVRGWAEEIHEGWNSNDSVDREEAVFMFCLAVLLGALALVVGGFIVTMFMAFPLVMTVVAAVFAALFLVFRWITKPGRFGQ